MEGPSKDDDSELCKTSEICQPGTSGVLFNVISTTECDRENDSDSILHDNYELSKYELVPRKSLANEVEVDEDSRSLLEDFMLKWNEQKDDGVEKTTPIVKTCKQLNLTIESTDSDVTDDEGPIEKYERNVNDKQAHCDDSDKNEPYIDDQLLTSKGDTIEVGKLIDISIAENIQKLVIINQAQSPSKGLSDQDISMELKCIPANKEKSKITILEDLKIKPRDEEMDVGEEIISNKSIVEKSPSTKTQNNVITENREQNINEILKDDNPIKKDDNEMKGASDSSFDYPTDDVDMDSGSPTQDMVLRWEEDDDDEDEDIAPNLKIFHKESTDLDITDEGSVEKNKRNVNENAKMVVASNHDNNKQAHCDYPDKNKLDIEESIETFESDDLFICSDKLKDALENSENVNEIITLNTNVESCSIDISPNVHHRINKPNVMLDIPTQEFSDIEAELDDDDDIELYNDDKDKNTEVNVGSMEVDSSKIHDKTNMDMQKSKNKKSTSDSITSGLKTKTESKELDQIMLKPTNGKDTSKITQYRKKTVEKIDDAMPSTSKTTQEHYDQKSSTTKSNHQNNKKPSSLKSANKKVDQKSKLIKQLFKSEVTVRMYDLRPSTSKLTDFIDKEKASSKKESDPSKQATVINYQKPSTSKSVQKIDHQKPSTSKLVRVIDDQKPSTSKSVQEIDHPKPSTSKFVQEIDHQKPSTSKFVRVIDNQQPSTSKSVQEIDHQKPSTSKFVQEIDHQKPSTSKFVRVIDNQQPSTSKSVQEIDHQKPSTSKFVQAIDDQKPSTSKFVQVIDDQKPSTSKFVQAIDDQKPSTSKFVQVIDDQKPSTSKFVQVIDDQKPSTSKFVRAIDDQKPSTSKFVQVIDDQKPSTSKPDTSIADETEEVTDSLGLLTESSRVMQNDDDDDELEIDDNDDDDDFDPYEETNSVIADDMDDSMSPPPEVNPLNKQPPPKIIEKQSDEGTIDIDIVDCEEENEPDIIDADTHKSKNICPPKKVINILEKILGTQKLSSSQKGVKGGTVQSYIELEESSDSDDVEEVSKSENSNVMSVNIPGEVEVMSTSGTRPSEILSKKGEVIINGVPKPPPHKVAKINTSEVTIKTTGLSTPSIHIPETTSIQSNTEKVEIFSLDSDDDDDNVKKTTAPTKKTTSQPKKATSTPKKTTSPPKKTTSPLKNTASSTDKEDLDGKCINPNCLNENQTYYSLGRISANCYSLTKRKGFVCEDCQKLAVDRLEGLVSGIRDMRPLLDLEMEAPAQELVEISDSDSDGEIVDDSLPIGEEDAKVVEENLVDMLNETWNAFEMEKRLADTEAQLNSEIEKVEEAAKEVNAMLDDCQKQTDAVKVDFYKDYEPKRKSEGAIIIHDTPSSSYSVTVKAAEEASTNPGQPTETPVSRYPKRKATSSAGDAPAKKPTVLLERIPLEGEKLIAQIEGDQNKVDDDKEVSVVKLSAESAPDDLPPPGTIIRPPLKTGMIVYAMRNAFGTWLKGKIMDVQAKAVGQQFTQCRVKFEHKIKNPCKVLYARCLAYPEPCAVRMTIGTRVVALFKDPHNTTRRESFYSGVIAEIPNPVNNYRYLVFFDDGYAQYVHHQDTRIVCESSNLVWEEVHPFIRDFICNYLLSYPERPMVRLHAGENLKTEWNGKWWESKVLQVDASIALIHFDEDNRTEWIYRGSTRLAPLYLELQAAEKAGDGRTRSRASRSKVQTRSNMPCVEYTRSDEQDQIKTEPVTTETQAATQQNEGTRKQRAVAKKSTTSRHIQQQDVNIPIDGVISRVVYYTPKNAVKPNKMIAHTCSIKCRRSDLLSLQDLRTYNPLAKPLLSGWEKQTIRHKGHKEIAYRAPCGRRLRNMSELHRYLRITHSELSVDLFDFTTGTHCLAEFVLNKCIVSKKDLSHGKENVPVPCVNYFDEALPEFCSYNTERTPTAGVPLNLDPEFLCGCDCTDDCVDKTKCACWKMTLEGAQTIGLEGPNVGYVYRRLPEPLPSGIYECNSRCKCKHTCLNRVAQHPLQLKLQVFKTINRGWGIRALNDIPKGAFLCVYAGNLLTDATANLDGLNEGDEYLAELDYIEVVEGMKEGYEDDVPDADMSQDKKSDSNTDSDSVDSDVDMDTDNKDDDFQPGFIPQPNEQFKKSLRKRVKDKKKEKKQVEASNKMDCITISDDEEVREPSRFTAQAGMSDRNHTTKRKRKSVRALYGKDEACYIMDAKVQGNIGRYLNHSCNPNVFVQNVFVDTHDPRFPWVAFFALSLVRAGTELTWNYNYDVGSVPGKVLYCYCGASNCRGRLL